MRILDGLVRQELRMPRSDATHANIYYNNPFALIHAAATVQPKFGSFLLKHAKRDASLPRIVIYHDETTPGNQHRPDHGRSYDAVLWAIAELPHFFRNRQHCFFKFAYVLSDDIAKIQGGIPVILKQVLLRFFSTH